MKPEMATKDEGCEHSTFLPSVTESEVEEG